MNNGKYILYRESDDGTIVYKCDFVDEIYGHRTRTTMRHYATKYGPLEAIEIAADYHWMIERAE